MKYITIDPSGTGTTALVCISDDKPFKVKKLDEKGQEVMIETYFYFTEIKDKEWKEHLNYIIKVVKNFKSDVIAFEETDFIKMMGNDMRHLFKLFGGIECIQYFVPEVKKIWGIKADQVKVLRRQISSGIKASEKYTNHNVYSNLPSEVKHLSFKDGRGGGYFFIHADGRKEKITVHQADAYLVYVIYKENERKYFERLKQKKSV